LTSSHDQDNQEPEDALAELILRASEEPSPEVLSSFYKLLLSMQWIVPERAQDNQLINQPEYPNPFLNILGIVKKEQVFAPIFSSDPRVREWSGHEIRGRYLSFKELLELLPNGWWIIINPGSEGEKDLSPWEIELLRGGESNIPALIEEILVEDVIEDIELSELEDSEHQILKTKLVDIAKQNGEVSKLFLLREKGKTLSEKETSSIILGILIDTIPVARREEIQNTFADAGAYTLIGSEKMKVRVGDSIDGNLLLGIFKDHQPFYEKGNKKSWLGKLFS
jgi:SseB protein N-terminal domain